MIEQKEITGTWYIPKPNAAKIPGKLTINQQEGAILELMGSFWEKFSSVAIDPKVILGISAQGQLITLYDCQELAYNLYPPGATTSKFSAKYTFIGIHLSQPAEIKFNRLIVHYALLDDWLGISGFEITRDFDDENLERVITIKYQSPQPVILCELEDRTISVKFSWKGPRHTQVQKEAEITQRPYVIFSLNNGKELEIESLVRDLNHFQNFLTLSISKSVYPTEIHCFTSKLTDEGSSNRIPVQVFYQLVEEPREFKPLLPKEMLFAYTDIGNQVEEVLTRWFDKFEMLEPVLYLYFSTLKNRPIYVNHKFQNIVAALEAYHRRTTINQEISPDEHEARIKSILEKLPEAHKEWLEGKLKYSNEPPLRKRLKELVERFENSLKPYIEDKKKFIEKVIATRNFQTHFDEELKTKAAIDGVEIYKLVVPLGIILESALMSELGFDLEKITKINSKRSIPLIFR